MGRRTFELSIIVLMTLVVVWIVLGIVFAVVSWGWVVVIGVLGEVIGIFALLSCQSCDYMAGE